MVTEIKDFKGTPVISLKESEDEEYGFIFGLKKAKLILDNLEDIKAFVKEREQQR